MKKTIKKIIHNNSMREIEVENKLRRLLWSQEEIKSEKRTQIGGVDIRGSKNKITYFVEVAGNKSPNNSPFPDCRKRRHFSSSFTDLCSRMNDNPNSRYIIGLPSDKYYRKKVNQIQRALKQLKISIYFVQKRINKIEKISF